MGKLKGESIPHHNTMSTITSKNTQMVDSIKQQKYQFVSDKKINQCKK